MPTCYVMIGLPASGKSTFMNFVYDPEFSDTVFVYSTDNVLERIAKQLGKTYDDVFQNHIDSAKTESDIWLAEAIKMKVDIYCDQTNLGVKKRRGIIDKMKRAGYDVEAIVFRAPESEDDIIEWNHRLKSRKGKTIPDNVIHNMVNSYVEPTLDEGFNKIRVYNIYGKVIGEQIKNG
jgi:predicted ABC-type ATPase